MKRSLHPQLFTLIIKKKLNYIISVMIFMNIIATPVMPVNAANDQPVIQTEQYANVKDFGAKGDGITDDTKAFRTSIATGLPVHVPSTDKCYIISDSLYLQNSISFADHAKLQFKVDFSIKYECYRWKNILVVENKINENTLYINNPQIDGGWAYAGCPLNWGEPGFYTGDDGHAIAIKSSTNVEVEGGNLTNLGGDGIYIGIDSRVLPTEENYSPKNINIEGTVIENPNRCILCIEAGQNCSFKNIKGFKHNNYVAAIDIEPATLRPYATIDNLLFDNCNIVADGSYKSEEPITQYGLSLRGKAAPFQIDCQSTAGHNWGDITVINSTFVANNCMAFMCTGVSNLEYFTKNLAFNNCKFESNYSAFNLWGKDSVTVKDCVVNLTADAHKSSSILSMADDSGSYNCIATIDNLKYNCLGDSQVFVYQMGKATVSSSEIVIKSVSPGAFEIYSALFFRHCQSFTVQNCSLSSMRNALMFTGENSHFYIANNTFVPNGTENPYHFCVWAGPTGTIDYSMSGNVFDTSATGTEKNLVDSTLPYLKGDLATVM